MIQKYYIAMIYFASISEMDFPGSSADKESTCNTGDPGSIPGSGRSPGEGIGLLTPVYLGFPDGSDSKCGRPGFDP